MGVDIYLLKRGFVTLSIGGNKKRVGTLRHLGKYSEAYHSHFGAMEETKERMIGKVAPAAVIVGGPSEHPWSRDPHRWTTGYTVLGWEKDRYKVSDFYWEFLPILGYAVSNFGSDEHMRSGSVEFVLNEMRNEILHPMSEDRAKEIGILDENGRLARQSQARILDCSMVTHNQDSNLAWADCVFENGVKATIATNLKSENIPNGKWYIGKTLSDTESYD